ncbi:unnamed protein product [Caenorhabditis sp. 36 PRJEB53466]|nr:unnamed protein product [Caenorhabditis sp. 36 PRJEB53466]
MMETFVEVQAEAIVSTCIQKSHHFTRDFDITHEYSHRCALVNDATGIVKRIVMNKVKRRPSWIYIKRDGNL